MENHPQRPAAVVVGLDCLTGLQCARILARRGIAVLGVARDDRHFCCRTRAAKDVVRAGPGDEGVLQALTDLAGRLQEKAVLYPCTDELVLAASRLRSALDAAYQVVLPAPDDLDALIDKSRSHRHARETGLCVPRTEFLRTAEEAAAAAAVFRFPCVLKPPVKSPEWLRYVRDKVVMVETPEHLEEAYMRCSRWAEELILQEHVEGTDEDMYSLYSYLDRSSEPLAMLVARKIRQWPPGLGSGCLAVQCEQDTVVHQGLKLLRGVRFRGLSSVQFKRDRRSGEFCFIEANVGRPALNMPLAEVCGVEMQYTMYCDAAGLPLPDARHVVHPGAKWICWKRDVASAMALRRRGDITLRGWIRSIQGRKWSAVLSMRDPAPFWFDVFRKLRGR